MASSRRSRIIAIVIALAVVAVCISLYISAWVNEGPMWRWVMTKRIGAVGNIGHPVTGWATVRRWWSHVEQGQPIDTFSHGPSVLYYDDTGFKAIEEHYKVGRVIRRTEWNLNGTVKRQTLWKESEGKVPSDTRTSPPWLWGVTDQTKPTAPWWGERVK